MRAPPFRSPSDPPWRVAVPDESISIGASQTAAVTKSSPPKRPIPAAGETWWIQATTGRALLTVEVIEATRRTVLLMQVCDGSVKPKSDAVALRYRISDFKWIEQVPA